MERAQYDTDLTDDQWRFLEELLPPASRRGAPRRVCRREVINAILYLERSGCQWRLLPHDFPNWTTVYRLFWEWSGMGLWTKILKTLREWTRIDDERDPCPSAAILDSQTVKTTEMGGPRGYDGGKKIMGRKRHIAVDSQGNLLAVAVLPAMIADYDGARVLLEKMKRGFSRLRLLWADSAYGKMGLPEWVRKNLRCRLQTVLRPVMARGFVVLPRRWVVERTFAWLGRNRRLSKDYERTTPSSEAFVQIAAIHLMLKRLAA